MGKRSNNQRTKKHKKAKPRAKHKQTDKEVYDMLERSNIDQFDRRKRKSFMHRLDTKKCNSALLHLMKSSAVNKGDVAISYIYLYIYSYHFISHHG